MNPIFPSILSTNFFDLESHLEEFASNKIDFIHLDVMDGHFVENISFGPAIIPAIRSKFNFKLDSHLMVSNPEKMIMKYIESQSDWISFLSPIMTPSMALLVKKALTALLSRKSML